MCYSVDLTLQIFTWFFASFTGSEVKRQIVTVRNIPQLYEHIAPDQIDVPPFVSDYDLKVRLGISRHSHETSSICTIGKSVVSQFKFLCLHKYKTYQ